MAILTNYFPYFKNDCKQEVWTKYGYMMQLVVRFMRVLVTAMSRNAIPPEIEYFAVQAITNLAPYIHSSNLYDEVIDDRFFTDICKIIEKCAEDNDTVIDGLQLLSAIGANEQCFPVIMQLTKNTDSMVVISILSVLERTVKNDRNLVQDFASVGIFDWIIEDKIHSANSEIKLKVLQLILTIGKCGAAGFMPEQGIIAVVDFLTENNSIDTLKCALLVVLSYLENDSEFISKILNI